MRWSHEHSEGHARDTKQLLGFKHTRVEDASHATRCSHKVAPSTVILPKWSMRLGPVSKSIHMCFPLRCAAFTVRFCKAAWSLAGSIPSITSAIPGYSYVSCTTGPSVWNLLLSSNLTVIFSYLCFLNAFASAVTLSQPSACLHLW